MSIHALLNLLSMYLHAQNLTTSIKDAGIQKFAIYHQKWIFLKS